MAETGKNIVVCLDGTGNQIEENLSNVLKLYRVLDKSSQQVVYYDQGVGTLGQKYTWGAYTQQAKNVFGLAFGLGIDHNVIEAYSFIARHYEERFVKRKRVRDKIFIFGFSRGAYTARVLAGMIYQMGLLSPHQLNLAGTGLTKYKESDEQPREDLLKKQRLNQGTRPDFKRVLNTRTVAVEFLGLWDTVSTVFIPNPDGLWPPIRLEKDMPYTSHNPAVRIMRHALAIDEFRRMYRVKRWQPGQIYKPNAYSQGEVTPQDAKEMWFSGCHADIGGGYDRALSGLSQFSLIWMLEEVQALTDLSVDRRMASYVTGVKPWSSTTKHLYPKPDPTATLHNSFNALWRAIEYFPKRDAFKEWPKRRSLFGYYIPNAEPRRIAQEDHIHPSVLERRKQVPTYQPENVPM